MKNASFIITTLLPPLRPSQNHALGHADKAETEVEFNN